MALYRLLDTLVDTMFPYLAAMDDRIDDLQDQIFENPKEEQLAAVFALKRQLVDMRKMVTPQRDMVSSMLTQVIPIPGMTAESERYVRDLYDHLIRISDHSGQPTATCSAARSTRTCRWCPTGSTT